MMLASAQRWEILEAIMREETLAIDTLVKRIGLSKTATRAHLLKLEEQGAIERVQLAGDRVGRPPLAFRVTEQARDLLPSREGALLESLLRFLGERGECDLVHAFFERVWAERGDEYAAELDARIGDAAAHLPDRLAALEAVLERAHFMPKVQVLPERDGDGDGAADAEGPAERVVVSVYHCPYRAAVRATCVPCKSELDFLCVVIGARPRRAQYPISPCVFEFAVPAEGREEARG